jgi:hypothetical protein
VDARRELNMPLPLVAQTNGFLTVAKALGCVDADFAVLFNMLARLAGLSED